MHQMLTFFLAATMAGAAAAASWVEVPGPTDSGRLHFDPISVNRIEPGRVGVTWKESTGIGKYWLWTGTVDCDARSITIAQGSLTEPRDGKTSLLPPSHGLMLPHFPVPDSGEARLIRALCTEVNGPEDAALRRLAAEARTGWGCAGPRPAVREVWCSLDPELTLTLGTLVLRLFQVSRTCEISARQRDGLIASVLDEPASTNRMCAPGNPRCDINRVIGLTSEIGVDLGAAEAGKQCAYLKSRLELLKEKQGRDEAIEDFWTCASKAVKSLEDGSSPADVVATGVFGACQQSIALLGGNSPSDAASIQRAVMPKIVARVLEERARKRAPAQKPRPKTQFPAV